MSEVLTVILLILKILGISLFTILGIVLLIILLVLLWPIKYSIKFDYSEKEFEVYAKASWMSFVRFIFIKKDDMTMRFKIFFWELYGPEKDKNDLKKEEKKKLKEQKKLKKEEKKKHNKNSSDKINTAEESNNTSVASSVLESGNDNNEKVINCDENPQSITGSLIDETVDNNNKETTDEESTDSGSSDFETDSESDKESDLHDDLSTNVLESNDSKTSSEKRKGQNKHNKEHKNVSHKNSFYDKIKRKIEVIQTEEFKKCFEKVSKKVIRLIKTILPHKWNVTATVGFDDPADTGKVLAISGFLYGLFPRHIRVIGDFENEVMDVHASAKGYINIAKILIILAELYFDKKLKKMYKKLKEA